MTITKEASATKPGRAPGMDKAAAIDYAARLIIASETEQRVRKTARLRKLRQASQPDAVAKTPARRKSRASASRA